jgi:uncharacterized phage protein (TIGR02218 family)
MKTLPAGLAAHVALGSTTLAFLLLITRTDGKSFAFTSADTDATINSVRYRSAPGLDISQIVTTAGLNVDNLELSTLDDQTVFLRGEVLDGFWNDAAFTIARYNFADSSGETETLMKGSIGMVRLMFGHIVAELRGLQQYLQQPLGSITSKTCRARLGDSRCKVNLPASGVAGQILSVSGKELMTDAISADTRYSEGTITFTSGALSGQTRRVKSSVISGLIVLSEPIFQSLAAGDTFTIFPGCTKRIEDCSGKFNNILNFQGEPHLPSTDSLTSPARL